MACDHYNYITLKLHESHEYSNPLALLISNRTTGRYTSDFTVCQNPCRRWWNLHTQVPICNNQVAVCDGSFIQHWNKRECSFKWNKNEKLTVLAFVKMIHSVLKGMMVVEWRIVQSMMTFVEGHRVWKHEGMFWSTFFLEGQNSSSLNLLIHLVKIHTKVDCVILNGIAKSSKSSPKTFTCEKRRSR